MEGEYSRGKAKESERMKKKTLMNEKKIMFIGFASVLNIAIKINSITPKKINKKHVHTQEI